MTLCDKGRGGQNWPKKRYVIVERPPMCVPMISINDLNGILLYATKKK